MKNNGLASLFMGCIIGYCVSEEFNFNTESGVFLFVVTSIVIGIIYGFP